MILVRLFSCHDCPSHALRDINSRGRLSGTVVRPLDLQSKYHCRCVPFSLFLNNHEGPRVRLWQSLLFILLLRLRPRLRLRR